jgi:hypothetical protein
LDTAVFRTGLQHSFFAQLRQVVVLIDVYQGFDVRDELRRFLGARNISGFAFGASFATGSVDHNHF